MEFRIPKHVEEKDTILGLQYKEWLFMAPCIALGYVTMQLTWVVVKVIVTTCVLIIPWVMLSQKRRGRRLSTLYWHVIKRKFEVHTYRSLGDRWVTTRMTGLKEVLKSENAEIFKDE